MSEEKQRQKSIIRVSIVGILANVALAAFKAAVGLFSHSIAITLDAVNNLSDAASSAITIVGTKLASKAPDRNHPYGHGRMEYLTSMIVSAIVLWAGLTALVEAIKGIVNPQTPSYKTIGLVIIAVAVVAKLILGRYVSSAGKRLDSDALVASGADATFDALISASTLVAALLYMFTGISLEAWLGAIISVIIIKSGVEMLQEALSKVLGARVEADLARGIKQTACSVDGVLGAYDLILADYGPQRLWGSIHVELDENLTARQIDGITRQIQLAIYEQHKVLVHTVGVYATNVSKDSEAYAMRAALDDIISIEPHVLQAHGLYVDEKLKGATFDLVIAFEAGNREEVRDRVVQAMHERFPEYAFVGVIDSDIAD